jgi:hypothetical protein
MNTHHGSAVPAAIDTYRTPEEHALREQYVERQLTILAMRAVDLAERVKCGDLEKVDAVDMAHSAAVISGLVDAVGNDAVQIVLANAFDGT